MKTMGRKLNQEYFERFFSSYLDNGPFQDFGIPLITQLFKTLFYRPVLSLFSFKKCKRKMNLSLATEDQN